jgi:hypothetical protein
MVLVEVKVEVRVLESRQRGLIGTNNEIKGFSASAVVFSMVVAKPWVSPAALRESSRGLTNSSGQANTPVTVTRCIKQSSHIDT